MEKRQRGLKKEQFGKYLQGRHICSEIHARIVSRRSVVGSRSKSTKLPWFGTSKRKRSSDDYGNDDFRQLFYNVWGSFPLVCQVCFTFACLFHVYKYAFLFLKDTTMKIFSIIIILPLLAVVLLLFWFSCLCKLIIIYICSYHWHILIWTACSASKCVVTRWRKYESDCYWGQPLTSIKIGLRAFCFGLFWYVALCRVVWCFKTNYNYTRPRVPYLTVVSLYSCMSTGRWSLICSGFLQ